ncbi:tape measure protein [Levilactobacillus brevis]|uniref:tape measure protein n=1 Tax=Levilactobacillus brevis TaxID=1580 RepID=UPI0012E983ED|nr:tape measure protein [Levilactobacillus brevis]MUV40580.1 peptidoglycan DD-metalloendopeptidase family protein [Levilactobacillus brevis]
MVKKIDAQMSTEVYLDSLQTSKSLKNLRSVVSSVTTSWKAQSAALRSTGEYVKAAETKYTGLGRAIKANRDVISSLRDKQKGLDQTTQEGARQYAKYQAQINRTETRIASLTRQQEKSKESLNGYKSGIISLQQSIKSSNDLTKSSVARLRAEGQEYKALSAEAKGYQSTLEKSSTLQSKQAAELKTYQNRVDDLRASYEKAKTTLKGLDEAGKQNTDEYKTAARAVEKYKTALSGANSDLNRQKIRVNETATSTAKLRTELTRVQSSQEKIRPTGLNRLRSSISKVNESTEKTSHLFGKIFGGTIAANAAVGAWNMITTHINDAIHAGAEYDKTQQKMLATWTTLAGSAKAGQAMVDTTNRLSVAMGQDVDVTDELNQQFYHVLDKQKPTERLTKSVLTMSDAVGLTSENTKNLGLNFTHMMSSSKMQVGDFNHITDALPMYGKALLEYEQKVQKNSKLTMSALRKQMSAGKISAKDAENVMNELGKKYSDASENLMKTLPGMERVIKARVPALLGDIEKPFMKAENPILGAVSKWVSDKRTEKEFTKVGTAATRGFNTITKAFAQAFNIKSVPRAMDGFMNGLAKTITKVSNSIAAHAKDIKGFFKIFSQISSDSLKVFVATLKALLPVLQVVGDFAAKHPKLFGDMIASTILMNGAFKALTLVLRPVAGLFKGVGKSMTWGKKLLGLGKDADGAARKLTPLGKALKGLRDIFKRGFKKINFKGLFSGLKDGKGLLGGLKSGKGMFSGIANLAKDGGGGAKGLLKTGAKSALKASPLSLALSATDLIGINKKNAGKKVGQTAGSVAGGGVGGILGSLILPGVGTAVGAAAGSWLGEKGGGKIGKLIQSNAKSWKKTLSNAFSGKLGWEKSIGKAVSNVGKSIGKGVKGWKTAFGKVFKNVGNFFKPLVKGASKAIKSVANIFKGAGKFILTALKMAIIVPIALVVGLAVIAFKKIKKPIIDVAKAVGKGVSAAWNGIKSVTSKVFGTVAKIAAKLWKPIGKTISRVSKAAGKAVRSAWNGIKSVTSKVFGAVGKITSKVWGGISKTVGHIAKGISKVVHSAWSGIKHATSSAWKAVEKYVINPVKRVRTAVNKYIVRLVVHAVKGAWSTIKRATSAAWKLIEKYVGKPVKAIYNTVHKWLGNIQSYWKKIWNAVVKFTENIWTSIKKKVGAGLGAVAKVINTGIKAINWVISKFGGKKTTIGLLSTHYAQGTGAGAGRRNPITKPTLATLNDGNDSPSTGNRELAVLPNGSSFMPTQRNWTGVVPAGTEVFTASETKGLMNRAGVRHFANGTGIFAGIGDALGSAGSWLGSKVGGAVDWAKNALGSFKSMVSTVAKIVAHPVASLKSFFTDKLNFKGIAGDVEQGLAGMFKGNVVNQAKSWWSAAWDMINSAINAGDDDAGGPITHSPGAGWSVTSGFGNRGAVSGGYSQHDGVDFSGGKTVHAMNTGTVLREGGAPAGWGGASGIGQNLVIGGGGLNYIYQELNGKYNSGAKFLVGKGDHVKAGQAIAVLGPSGTHVHVGATKHAMFSIGGSSTAGWLDPTKIKSSSVKSDDSSKSKTPKVSGALQKLVKSQLGSGVFDFIAKHLAPLVAPDFGSASGGYSTSMIKKAAEAMHVNLTASELANIKNVIQHESGGNASVVNNWDSNAKAGHPSKGLLQFIDSTFKHYAVSGHKNILSAYDQLLAMFNDSNWKRDVHTGGWGPTGHRRYENGGIVSRHQMIEVAEHNHPEAIVPLDTTKRSRGWEIIGKVAAQFAGQDPALNNTGKQNVVADTTTTDNKLDKLIGLLSDFMTMFAQKPTGISTRAVYDAYNTEKGRHYQLDANKRG